MSKLVVTIPTYNAGSYLKHTVAQIRGERKAGVNLELYLVDDCSTDDTREYIRAISDKEQWIHPIYHDHNMGLTASFNDCLRIGKATDADYMVLMCQDDAVYSGSFYKKMKVFDKNSSVTLVCGETDIVNSRGKKILTRKSLPSGILDGTQYVKKSIYRGNIFGEPSVVMFRLDSARSAGEFDETLFYSLDGEYFSRIAVQGKIGSIGEALGAFRISHTSASSKILKNYTMAEKQNSMVVAKLYSLLGLRETFLRRVLRKCMFAAKSTIKALIFRFLA